MRISLFSVKRAGLFLVTGIAALFMYFSLIPQEVFLWIARCIAGGTLGIALFAIIFMIADRESKKVERNLYNK